MSYESRFLCRIKPEEIIEVRGWDEELAGVPAGSAEGLSERAALQFELEASRAMKNAEKLPEGHSDISTNLTQAAAYQRCAYIITRLLDNLNIDLRQAYSHPHPDEL